MFNLVKYQTLWLSILLLLITSCNIFDFEMEKIEFGTWDDFPNFGDFSYTPHPYISHWEAIPYPIIPEDSLQVTCFLHDTLAVTDYYFNWSRDIQNALPAGLADHNIYKTTAPDSAGTYMIRIYLHSDSTSTDTLDNITVYLEVENP